MCRSSIITYEDERVSLGRVIWHVSKWARGTRDIIRGGGKAAWPGPTMR